VVVGCLMVLATVGQTFYWTVVTPPTVDAVFLVSMEALLFAGYGVIATGLGFRATERVTLLVAVPPVVKTTKLRANARGRFRVVFRVKVGRCDAAVVQAIGARGSRATFQHDALDCAEP